MQKNSFRSTVTSCYLAYITQAIVNNLAPLLFIVFQDKFSISFTMLGNLVLINFGTQLTVDLLAVKLVDRIGYRPCLVAAHAFSVLGLVLLGVLPNLLPQPYVGLIIAVVLYALGGGLIEVLVSPVVDAIPGDAKASAMSLLHSFYCWGQVAVVLLSTLLLKVMGSGLWFVLPLLWALLPLYNLFRFLKVPLMPPVSEEARMPLRKLFSSKIFLVAMLLMVCAGASELAMSQWSSLFAEKGLGVPKVVGDLLGPCLFGVLMGVGRVVYGLWGEKIDLHKALLACSGLCILSYAMAALLVNPFLSLLGCALCGLSVSLMWPGTFSYTAQTFPNGGTAMFGLMALCGDLGCSLGPWLTGLVSDTAQRLPALASLQTRTGLSLEQLGLKSGLFVGILFPAVLLGGVLLMRRLSKSK